jgi:peptidoglycan/xylan/chitin deacetylase (PgdA/CDA1 family)
VQALEKLARYKWVKELYPSCVWNIEGGMKDVYLTFDDGPWEGITEWVLKTLESYKAKATFFCIGENVNKSPEIFKQILTEGHAVGNHTFHHANGWKTLYREYIEEVNACDKIFSSNLFRPPYGKLKPLQIRTLHKKYHIIMWSYLTGDYRKDLDCQMVIEDMKRKIVAGDIIVFHDSVKAEANMKIILPALLEDLSSKGFTFKSIQLKDKN